MHGRIMNIFARCGFGRLHEICQGRGHVFDRIDQHNLRFAVWGAKACRSGFDHLAELNNGSHCVLSSHSQLFLRGGRSGNKSLGIFNKSFGSLEDVFTMIYKEAVRLAQINNFLCFLQGSDYKGTHNLFTINIEILNSIKNETFMKIEMETKNLALISIFLKLYSLCNLILKNMKQHFSFFLRIF